MPGHERTEPRGTWWLMRLGIAAALAGIVFVAVGALLERGLAKLKHTVEDRAVKSE